MWRASLSPGPWLSKALIWAASLVSSSTLSSGKGRAGAVNPAVSGPERPSVFRRQVRWRRGGLAALPSTLGLAFSSLGPEMSEEEWLLNTAPCIWGASLSEKPGTCCRAEKLKAILSPSLKCMYFTTSRSSSQLIPLASGQLHRAWSLGGSGGTALGWPGCWQSSLGPAEGVMSPPPPLLSEEVMKAKHNSKAADRLEVHL